MPFAPGRLTSAMLLDRLSSVTVIGWIHEWSVEKSVLFRLAENSHRFCLQMESSPPVRFCLSVKIALYHLWAENSYRFFRTNGRLA